MESNMKEQIAQMIITVERQLEYTLQELERADEYGAPTKEFELRVAEAKGELKALRMVHGMLV